MGKFGQTYMHRKKTMQRHKETDSCKSKNIRDLPELGRGIEQILPKPSKGTNPADILTMDFQPPEL